MYKKAFLTGCLGHTRRITNYTVPFDKIGWSDAKKIELM